MEILGGNASAGEHNCYDWEWEERAAEMKMHNEQEERCYTHEAEAHKAQAEAHHPELKA
jgi:hypothetical protein